MVVVVLMKLANAIARLLENSTEAQTKLTNSLCPKLPGRRIFWCPEVPLLGRPGVFLGERPCPDEQDGVRTPPGPDHAVPPSRVPAGRCGRDPAQFHRSRPGTEWVAMCNSHSRPHQFLNPTSNLFGFDHSRSFGGVASCRLNSNAPILNWIWLGSINFMWL